MRAAFAEGYDREEVYSMSTSDPVDILRTGTKINHDNRKWANIERATIETALRAKFGKQE